MILPKEKLHVVYLFMPLPPIKSGLRTRSFSPNSHLNSKNIILTTRTWTCKYLLNSIKNRSSSQSCWKDGNRWKPTCNGKLAWIELLKKELRRQQMLFISTVSETVMSWVSFCSTKISKKLHLFVGKVVVKSWI